MHTSIKLIPQPGGNLLAELTTPCGKVHPCAMVLDPDSRNPGLKLMIPSLGFNSILDIINQTTTRSIIERK